MADNPPTPDKAGSRPIRRTDITMHELDGEALIYDPRSADTHRLNSTAYFIWRQCDGSRNTRQIAERLMDVYNVSTEAAREHVERTLEQFHERNLVTAAGQHDSGT